MSTHDVKIVLVAKQSKNNEFEKLLRQVFPQQIPIDLIEQVVLEFTDGSKAQLDTRELEHPLPTAPNKTWQQLIQAFQKVKQITIVVDVNKVEESVGDKVGSMLGKHFE